LTSKDVTVTSFFVVRCRPIDEVVCDWFVWFYCWNRLREKSNGSSYALSISHKGVTKHYKIDKYKYGSGGGGGSGGGAGERLAIEEGPQFENLMDVSTTVYIL